MMYFPVFFPEKPKPPLIWPKRLLPTVVALVGASVALVGASTIATYLVMPWISTSGTMTAFEDRLIIHSHEAILSHPTNEGLGTHIEAILDTTPRPPPVSSTRTITPNPTIITQPTNRCVSMLTLAAATCSCPHFSTEWLMSARLSIAGNRVNSFVVLPNVRGFDSKQLTIVSRIVSKTLRNLNLSMMLGSNC